MQVVASAQAAPQKGYSRTQSITPAQRAICHVTAEPVASEAFRGFEFGGASEVQPNV